MMRLKNRSASGIRILKSFQHQFSIYIDDVVCKMSLVSDITVVIPVFNASAFLKETLQTVWDQSVLPAEVVLVDDHSTDDSVAVAERLAGESPVAVRLIQTSRNSGGPATPMNLGVQAARTKYICMLDHDDWMAPTRLEEALKALSSGNRPAMVMGNYELVCNGKVVEGCGSMYRFPQIAKVFSDTNTSTAFLDRDNWLGAFFSESIQCSCSNHFFPKILWDSVGGYREEIGLSSDFDFVLRAFGDGIYWTRCQSFRKRVHDGNAWQATLENRALAMRIREDFTNRFCREDDRKIIEERFLECLRKEVRWLRWNGYNNASIGSCISAIKKSPRAWIFREITLNCLGLIRQGFKFYLGKSSPGTRGYASKS